MYFVSIIKKNIDVLNAKVAEFANIKKGDQFVKSVIYQVIYLILQDFTYIMR